MEYVATNCKQCFVQNVLQIVDIVLQNILIKYVRDCSSWIEYCLNYFESQLWSLWRAHMSLISCLRIHMVRITACVSRHINPLKLQQGLSKHLLIV